MPQTTCTSCEKIVTLSSFGRCPVCGEAVASDDGDHEPQRGDPAAKAKLALVLVAVLVAIGWVGWTYKDVFRNDPEMLVLCAVCSVVGVAAGWLKLRRWGKRIEAVQDLRDGTG